MQKFIAIPMPRYNQLLDYERNYKSPIGTIKEASDAIKNNQETQEFLQRKQEYKEKKEDIPKTLDKEIPIQTTTSLPPPSLYKKRKKSVDSKKTVPLKVPKKLLTDNQKRKPRQKKNVIPKKHTGYFNWKFIHED